MFLDNAPHTIHPLVAWRLVDLGEARDTITQPLCVGMSNTEAQARKNADRLRRRVEDLENKHLPWFSAARVDPSFWITVKEIQEETKTLSLFPKDRQEVRAKIDTLCEKAKRVLGKRADESGIKRDWLLRKLRNVRLVKHAVNREQVDAARTELYEVLDLMKKGPGENSYQLLRDDHDTCWAEWQNAKKDVDLAYDRFRAFAAQKSSQWRAGQEVYIQQKLQSRGKLMDDIHRIQGQIDNCEGMLENAKSADFAQTVRGWIREKEERIQTIEGWIRDLDEKIRSARSKL